METILFERKLENFHNIVFRNTQIFHIIKEVDSVSDFRTIGKFSSSNTLKIYIRNSSSDGFLFESAFHILMKSLSYENMSFRLFLFEELEYFDILLALISFLNYSSNCNILVESDENHFIISKDGYILYQSFCR